MKFAVLLARTSSGFETVKTGEDISAIKAAFKTIKVADAFQVNGREADAVFYLDSSGNVRRKSLSGGDGASAARKLAAQAEADQIARAEAAASAQAKAVAQKAVGVITDAIKAGVGESATLVAETEDPANRFAPQKPGAKRR